MSPSKCESTLSLSVSDLLSVTESESVLLSSPDTQVPTHRRYHVRSNCSKLRITTFVILQNPLEIIATIFASHGTCRTAINSNLHNTSHNEAPRCRLVFSTCLMTFSAVIMGISPNDAAHVIEWYGSASDYAGLNDAHGGSVRKTRYYMR